MSEFKRKTQTTGFEAGEESFEALEPVETPPDFSALEAESGFSAGQAEDRIQQIEQASEPEPAIGKSSGFDIDRAESAPTPVRPSAEEPAKKRYYSPGEVMKKKGCIGCGGMALALPVMLAVLALAVALF